MNIPIYRAKKIGTDEYTVGLLCDVTAIYRSAKDTEPFIRASIYIKGRTVDVDSTTLAIHFPDMLDSQRNKIFIALGKDGKGGDLVKLKGESKIVSLEFNSSGTIPYYHDWEDYVVQGIKK